MPEIPSSDHVWWFWLVLVQLAYLIGGWVEATVVKSFDADPSRLQFGLGIFWGFFDGGNSKVKEIVIRLLETSFRTELWWNRAICSMCVLHESLTNVSHPNRKNDCRKIPQMSESWRFLKRVLPCNYASGFDDRESRSFRCSLNCTNKLSYRKALEQICHQRLHRYPLEYFHAKAARLRAHHTMLIWWRKSSDVTRWLKDLLSNLVGLSGEMCG